MTRFGVMLPQEGVDFEATKNVCAECERLGFDSAWVVDHFYSTSAYGDRRRETVVLECWTTLSALMAATTRLRIGPLVTCSSYRRPPLLAKMAATVDVISNGRLDLGIGAGWFEDDYVSFGIPFPETPVRIAQLEEALEIIKMMWTQSEASFKGNYFAITNASCTPKPVQKPHPPIWIGAEGKVMLRTVARYADVWNFASDIRTYTPSEYREKVKLLEERCSSVGRNPEEIGKSILLMIIIAQDAAQLKNTIKRLKPKDVPMEYYERGRVIGTPKECAEQLDAYVKAGADRFELLFPDVLEHPLDTGSLRLFSESVMPSFLETTG